MEKRLRTAIRITIGMLIISIIGGCVDDAPTEDVVALPPLEGDDAAHSAPSAHTVLPPPVHTVKVFPDPCIPIPPATLFVLTFDQSIDFAAVNDTPATGAGRNWMVMPGLEVGTARLNIEWYNKNGTRGATTLGPYVVLPDGGVLGPPAITNATVADGAANVDPALINAGGCRFDFNERITGTVKLTDEAGVDLNWIASVAFHTATLTRVAGQELANETTYKIEIDVQDSASNRTEATITFVTKPK